MVVWLVVWLVGWLVLWFSGRLYGLVGLVCVGFGCMVGWVIVRWFGCWFWMFGWLYRWLVGWLYRWLVVWLVGCLVVWFWLVLVVWLFGWLYDWLIGWLVALWVQCMVGYWFGLGCVSFFLFGWLAVLVDEMTYFVSDANYFSFYQYILIVVTRQK
jgi:hypothetical protein